VSIPLPKRNGPQGLPSLLLTGPVALSAVNPTHAIDRFAFHDARHVLAFSVPGTERSPATVDQTAVTHDRARRFYQLGHLDVLDMTFETKPARFWRVAFLDPGQTMRLCAVVLPAGRRGANR
jgi:hypothetical protein